jgi:polyhydroxyalkanoate synthesis repressor PhaR
MLVIKKYGNRRLYDTTDSRYITLEELAQKVKSGEDVRVLDARSEKDLTQVTLAQIILESRGAAKLLPVTLLAQLVRMEDEGLTEFFGRFLSAALEAYQQARHGAQQMASFNPFATMPFGVANALAGMMNGLSRGGSADSRGSREELDELRQEIQELRQSIRPPKRRR